MAGGGIIESRDLALALARAAYSRKAEEIQCLDLSGKSSFCDAFLICSASNRRQVRAIADGVVDDLRKQGIRPIGVEGLEASRWVLIDFGDVIVHVFDDALRGFYDLEGLWADAKRVSLDLVSVPEAPRSTQPAV
jgi:ribosome-associated protein